MNKRDLIDAISGRLGDKKTATEAVNAVLDTIQLTVAKGDKVAITGFGVFEKPGTAVIRAQVPGRRGLQGGRQRREEARREEEVVVVRFAEGARLAGPLMRERNGHAAQRSPGRLRSAVVSSRSMSSPTGSPLASHIFGKYEAAVMPGIVLISLTRISPSGR